MVDTSIGALIDGPEIIGAWGRQRGSGGGGYSASSIGSAMTAALHSKPTANSDHSNQRGKSNYGPDDCEGAWAVGCEPHLGTMAYSSAPLMILMFLVSPPWACIQPRRAGE